MRHYIICWVCAQDVFYFHIYAATARIEFEMSVNDEVIYIGEHLAMLSEPRERMPSV